VFVGNRWNARFHDIEKRISEDRTRENKKQTYLPTKHRAITGQYALNALTTAFSAPKCCCNCEFLEWLYTVYTALVESRWRKMVRFLAYHKVLQWSKFLVPKVGLDIEFKGSIIQFNTCTVKRLLLKRWKFVIVACLACYFKCIILPLRRLRPHLYGLEYVPEITLPTRQLCRAFICENGFPTGRVKLDSASLHNP